MSGGGAGGGTRVVQYRMSIHYGICHGPVDALVGMYYDERLLWTGNVTNQEIVFVYQPDFMGGLEKEGGVIGWVHNMPGGPGQEIEAELAARLRDADGNPGTADTVPSYRGIHSLFMVGDPGFYWGANSPYIRSFWAKVRRSPKCAGLDPEKSMIGVNANPAYIIFECLTNTDWGMGASPSKLDIASFASCARTLAEEEFGVSMIWTGQAKIEDFVQEVVDHIDGSLAMHPRTGLMYLKLIRADYIPDALPLLNPDNCRVLVFQRKGWGETTNEINASWTNPETEQDETVTFHDLANIAVQGNIVSETRNYYGIRDANLAMRVAMRDCHAAGYPVATAEIEVDRTAWDWIPGDVVRLTSPEHRIYNLVMRIGPISYGKPGTPRISTTLVEDVFYLPASDFVPPPTDWEDPIVDPTPMLTRVEMAPVFLIARQLGVAAESLVHPDVYVVVLANSNTSSNLQFDLRTIGQNAVGQDEWQSLGLKPQVEIGMVNTQFESQFEVATTFAGFKRFIYNTVPTARPIVPAVGDLIWMTRSPVTGETGRGRDQEIALITDVSSSGAVTLRRGVLDTIPLPLNHANVWNLGAGVGAWDQTLRADGDSVFYKMLSRTASGTLSIEDAPTVGTTLWNRAYLAPRPANVKLNGVLWGPARVDTGALTLTWARRNRLTETSQILAWTDGDVTPETGQTVTITVFISGGGPGFAPGAQVAKVEGLTGVSHTFAQADLATGAGQTLMYRVESFLNYAPSFACVEWEFGYGTAVEVDWDTAFVYSNARPSANVSGFTETRWDRWDNMPINFVTSKLVHDEMKSARSTLQAAYAQAMSEGMSVEDFMSAADQYLQSIIDSLTPRLIKQNYMAIGSVLNLPETDDFDPSVPATGGEATLNYSTPLWYWKVGHGRAEWANDLIGWRFFNQVTQQEDLLWATEDDWQALLAGQTDIPPIRQPVPGVIIGSTDYISIDFISGMPGVECLLGDGQIHYGSECNVQGTACPGWTVTKMTGVNVTKLRELVFAGMG